MSLNEIIVVDKTELDQIPDLKSKLFALVEQMEETGHNYTFLPRPDNMQLCTRLLETHDVSYCFPGLASQ